MADWVKPDLSSLEVDAIDEYKDRDVDNAVMFDAGTITNIPENAIRFNVTSGVMQRREGGAWVTKTLDILSGTSGTLTVARGGTGATTISGAQGNLQVPPTSRSVTGGNGLTGGGSLASDRTITLGTPSTITDGTTNNVTGSSHTHAINHATTLQRGIVQLIDSTTSTSTTTAATPNAVKTAKDAATPLTSSGTSTNSSSGSGHSHSINSSSSVTSTSTTNLANSAAVKTAYDKGVSADSNANSRLLTANNLQEIEDAGAASQVAARTNLGATSIYFEGTTAKTDVAAGATVRLTPGPFNIVSVRLNVDDDTGFVPKSDSYIGQNINLIQIEGGSSQFLVYNGGADLVKVSLTITTLDQYSTSV